jgi:hypothetical protein
LQVVALAVVDELVLTQQEEIITVAVVVVVPLAMVKVVLVLVHIGHHHSLASIMEAFNLRGLALLAVRVLRSAVAALVVVMP